jgi:hypothetical protein
MLEHTVLFNGLNASGQFGLWVTDGTADGTEELSPILGANSGGVSPNWITVFNGHELFEGDGPSSIFGLWITDGTAAGTSEITGISGGLFGTVGSPYGSPYGQFTIFNGELLFSGVDASGLYGLWQSDGTAAGTHEIGGLASTGVSGASHGFGVTDLTVFNNEVLFEGTDASGGLGFWYTDGTALGTHEIGGLDSTGITGAALTGLNPHSMTLYNGEVIFEGQDASGGWGLWETDGTAGGTREIGGLASTGISGAWSGGIFGNPSFGPVNPDFTLFDGRLLFEALDTSGHEGLWVTDGTAPGTHEIGGIGSTGISGAASGGFLALNAPSFTVFNGQVLFEGLDASIKTGLWVTDGTAIGTHEIGGLGSSGIVGASSAGMDFQEPVIFNDQVLFASLDSRSGGLFYMWATDGTAGGTHELYPITGASDGLGGLQPEDLAVGVRQVPPINNFNSNNISDILFRSDTTGDTWFAQMSSSFFVGWHQIGGSDTHYSIVGIGDFYGLGTSDILYRSASTGDTWFEAMSAGAFDGWHQVGGSNTNYAVAGVGDFYGNGTSDILFRNNSTGDTWFEAMSNGAPAGWHQIGGSDTHYSVVGIGDFFESGVDNILFRNNSTGDTWIEQMTNGAFAGWDQIGGSDTHYSVAGVGDFFGNGADDILFRNSSTGDTWFEAISNGAFAGWTQIGGSDTTYAVVGIGDYSGNNTSDVLFRNSAGDTWFEAISNGAFAGWNQIGGSNTSYSVPITVGPPALT